jgi:nucleoporin POM152
LQPESSGNYTYTFTQLSDANYKRVKLDGPSINQVVHPLASANIVFHSAHGVGNKRTIGSCSGKKVDVEVDLRVSSALFLTSAVHLADHTPSTLGERTLEP